MRWRGASGRAIERVAENRIRQAMAEGAFDHLPGAGRPIPGLDEPYDPDWWLKSWLARERLAGLARPRPSRDLVRTLYRDLAHDDPGAVCLPRLDEES